MRKMRPGKGLLMFAILVACAAAFVWLTSLRLPGSVASHFGDSGLPNGFMPHDFYVRFMLVFVIGLPALLVFITWRAVANPKALFSLPNKDYWLAPDRLPETVAYLRAGSLWFGVMLVVFLCYVHWLVVLANAAQPARLAESWLVGGLLAFFAALLVLLKLLVGHFRRTA
jgi:hypothetical protein